MKKKRVLEVFIVETKAGLMFSHKDISGRTTLYDSYKLTTITELGGIDVKQPDILKLKKPVTTSKSKNEIGFCEISLGHYRTYIKKNVAFPDIISQQRREIPGNNGTTTYISVLKSPPENKAAATKIIKQAILDNKLSKVTWLN